MTRPDVFRFEIEWDDGTTEIRECPVTFDDVPVVVLAGILDGIDASDHDALLSALLAWRLNVPLEASERLVDALNAGEGVRVA